MPPGAEEGNGPPQLMVNLYESESASGKHKVFIQKIDNSSEVRKSISVLKVAEILNKITKGKNICDIKKVGRNRIIVECTESSTANALVQSSELKNKDLNAYIPNFLIARPAIIKNIDSDYSEDTLKNIIDSRQFKIKNIIRMNRRIIREEKIEYVPSNTIKIFFYGQNIPEYIYIWNARFPCEPFIRAVKQCYRCFRYGHFAKQCKNNYERCSRCGDKDHTKKDCKSEKIKCANCTQNHEPTDKDCPERLRQKQITELMATHNMSYHEAFLEVPKINERENQYSVRTENKFSALSNYEEDFPEMNKTVNVEIPSYKPNPISRTKWIKNKNVNNQTTNYTKKTINKRSRNEENSGTEEDEGKPKETNIRKRCREDATSVTTEAIIHKTSLQDLDRIDVVIEDAPKNNILPENRNNQNHDTIEIMTDPMEIDKDNKNKNQSPTNDIITNENLEEIMETRGRKSRGRQRSK